MLTLNTAQTLLVESSTRANGKRLLTHVVAERLVQAFVGKAYKPTVQAMYTNPEQFAKIKQSILAEFNGHNHDELAVKYKFTPRYIEWLITQSQTDASADPRDRSQQGL